MGDNASSARQILHQEAEKAMAMKVFQMEKGEDHFPKIVRAPSPIRRRQNSRSCRDGAGTGCSATPSRGESPRSRQHFDEYSTIHRCSASLGAGDLDVGAKHCPT